MPDTNNWRGAASTRRKFLKYGALGGTVFLAGCQGDSDTSAVDQTTTGTGESDGGSGNTGSDGGGGGTQFTVFDPLTSGAAPKQRHLNPWMPTQTGCWHPGACIFDRMAVYSPTQNEAYPLMAKSWKMSDDKTLEVTLNENWTWHNGDQFVAQDWVMQSEIEQEIRGAADDSDSEMLIESTKAVDDQHIRIKLTSNLSEIFAVQNTIGIYNGNLARGVFTKHTDKKWSDWHKRLKNSSGDQKTKVIEEITTTAYPKLTNDPIGHGPFKISEVGDNIIVMEKYEDHPNAGNINFDKFALKLFSTNKPFQPYSRGEVDAAHKGFPVQKDLKSQLPKGHQLFREGRSSNKLFSFNCGHGVEGYDTPFTSVNVRKAVAHVFNRQQVKQLLQGVNRLFNWAPCRVPGKVLKRGEHPAAEWVKDFTVYGKNDTQRAAELLRQENYEKRNGKWFTPDGKRFKIEILNGADRQDINVLKRNLNEFGISTKQLQVDDATFDKRRKNGQFDIMPDGSSANGVTAMWSIGLVPDWIQSITHFKPEREIPMPVGDPDGGSGTKTINVENHIRQWQTTGNSKYHKELMWWWNQTLPEHENMYQPDAGAYNSAKWALDVKPAIKNGVDDALYIAPKMSDGTIRHKG